MYVKFIKLKIFTAFEILILAPVFFELAKLPIAILITLCFDFESNYYLDEIYEQRGERSSKYTPKT